MFVINKDKSISLTRGDAIIIDISARISEDESYTFETGDVVTFKVMQKNKCDAVVLSKTVIVDSATDIVTFEFTKEDTKIGDTINNPKDYWYEVELNPETDPRTIIGYDNDGPKLFRLFPEGGDV